MFDFDFSKLLLIGVIALIFIPPKDLPAAMRTVGQLLGKARRMAAEFQGQFNEAIREAELDNLKDEISLKKELGELKQAASLDASMAHVRDVASAVAATAPIAVAQAAGSVEPLPAAVSVETRPVAEAASVTIMGPLAPPEPDLAPAEVEKSVAAPDSIAAPLPPTA